VRTILNLSDLREIDIELKNIFLDPNNPRFSIETEVKIPDKKIMEKAVQEKCLTRMKNYGIDALRESIRRVGFMPIDKVVVRPLPNGKFVVVEGNRRIAALKILQREIDNSEIQLNEKIKETILKFNVFEYRGTEKDIAWIIQGIRHISGIRNWPSYQQAEVLVKLSQEKKIGVREASNIVGIGPIIAGRLVRALNGFKQAKKDDEYGQYIKPSHFSYFAEAIFVKPILYEWLSWSEKSKKFENIKNLKKLLSWIIPKDGKDARIGRAMYLRDTLSVAISRHPDLMKRFENEETMTMGKLNFEMGKRTPTEVDEWLHKISEFNTDLEELPSIKISKKRASFQKALKETVKIVKKHLEILKHL